MIDFAIVSANEANEGSWRVAHYSCNMYVLSTKDLHIYTSKYTYTYIYIYIHIPGSQNEKGLLFLEGLDFSPKMRKIPGSGYHPTLQGSRSSGANFGVPVMEWSVLDSESGVGMFWSRAVWFCFEHQKQLL